MRNCKKSGLLVCFVVVTICMLFIYYDCIFGDSTNIYMDIGADTYCSYWPARVFVRNWLSNPSFYDLSFGLGRNALGTVLDVLVDPFNIPCYFFDSDRVYIGLLIGTFLKYYVLTFYAYMLVSRHIERTIVQIMSTNMIVFCGFFVCWGQHYSFATTFVFYLACLYYFERYLYDDKAKGFVISTAFFIAVWYYSAYMFFLYIIPYYFLWLFWYNRQELNEQRKIYITKTINVVKYSLLSVVLSLPLLIPHIIDVMNSPRVSGKLLPSFELASKSEYISLVARTLSINLLGINDFSGYRNYYESPLLFFGVIGVIFLLYNVCSIAFLKKNLVPVCVIAFSIVFLYFSSPIFNGFSTVAYRWLLVYIPLFAIVAGDGIDQYLNEPNNKKLYVITILICTVSLIIFSNVCQSDDKISNISEICIVSVCVTLLIIAQIHLKCTKYILFAVIMVDLMVNANISVNNRNLIKKSEISSLIYFDSSNDAIEYLNEHDNGYYRIYKDYIGANLNDWMIQNYNSETLYSSVLSGDDWRLIDEFGLETPRSNYLHGFEDRQILRDISGSKYRFSKINTSYYGYDYLQQYGDVFVYKNKYCGGFATLYSDYVSENDIEKLTPYERQDILRKALITNCSIDGLTQVKTVDCDLQAVKSISTVGGVKYEIPDSDIDTAIVVKIDNASEEFILTCKGNQNSQIIVSKGTNDYVYIDNESITEIEVPENVMDEVRVYVTNDEYDASMVNLQMHSIDPQEINNEYIHFAKFECDKTSILNIPIGYDSNWVAYVNGNKVPIIKCNYKYLGVLVNKGENEVELRYQCSWIKPITTGYELVIAMILIMIISKNVRRSWRKNKI